MSVKFKQGSAAIGRAAVAADGLEVTQEIQGLGVPDVAVPVGREQAMVQQLSLRRDVDYAEVDYLASAQVEPNDPNYVSGKQWGLVKIGAAQAWGVTTGAPNVIIALVDTGIDLAHPDLASKLWQNPHEIPNNGKDDDQNGCVDDVYGCHYRASDEVYGDGRVADENGHGTHVAGIAAAATNNGVGVAGVSWQSAVMAVKVLDASGSGAYSDIAQGILYAANNGASVINLSLGGAAASQTLCEAVSAAVAKGKEVVAAVGNTGKDSAVFYPAMCPGVLAVAATTTSDQRADFSIPGARVDLAAPGVQITSTWYFSGLGQSGYRSEQGTSQAVPFVSGAAALVWARWPSLTAEGVKAQLLGTVVDVGTPGKDDGTGWGRLDAAAAVAAPAPAVDLRLTASVAPQTVVAGNPLKATFTVTNAGATAATSVTLHASLPAAPDSGGIESGPASCSAIGSEMTCGLTRLDPGVSITVVTPTAVGDGQVTTATANAAQTELTPGDNSQTVTSNIGPALSGRIFLPVIVR